MNQNFQQVKDKMQDWKTARQTVQTWQQRGEEVVFTNGCFDLLHYGHVYYLAEAASLGNRLIVGLNGDASIQRLKGEHRPIKEQLSREHVLASLAFVDLVVVFEQDTPLDLISLLLPDILVKGGDWQPKDIVGSDVVMEHGGVVKSLAFIEGYSTTRLEQKILKSQ
ncbi:MAG: D-glycero-beta-D-manno-heptose 1-phosphate adenylyltransferase [Aureispira sp.]|nr:D-glycero-beta-D-manno-heptose 1-phosphate adenylyltransferase [Aureispira sp.]